MKKFSIILAGLMISCSLQAANTESNTETGVESEQVQIKKSSKKVIKKSIEREGDATLVTEYDQQGNIIKITESNCSDCSAVEFTLKNGKIVSAKGGSKLHCEASVNKQKNIATYCWETSMTMVEFNEFGYKEVVSDSEDGKSTETYEYNKDGLLVKGVIISEDYFEGTSHKATITYTYDVMSQDWTKRTATYNDGDKYVTTRTVEYW